MPESSKALLLSRRCYRRDGTWPRKCVIIGIYANGKVVRALVTLKRIRIIGRESRSVSLNGRVREYEHIHTKIYIHTLIQTYLYAHIPKFPSVLYEGTRSS